MPSHPFSDEKSTSKYDAYREPEPRRSRSANHGLRNTSATPVWLGTMSMMIPRPRSDAATRSARSPSRPPSVADTWGGGTQS
ncbi:Uncharacterised protein [Mycobacteroides abscessus subsp. abscessus]|nr:Uncharacterised protein [Mycobacteroides abscessus subsp. abscessus]